MDCMELRSSLDWEKSQGAVLLVRELLLQSPEALPLEDNTSDIMNSGTPLGLVTTPLLFAPSSSSTSVGVEEKWTVMDALWALLQFRNPNEPGPAEVSNTGISSNRRKKTPMNSAVRANIRNIEKLQAAIYNEV